MQCTHVRVCICRSVEYPRARVVVAPTGDQGRWVNAICANTDPAALWSKAQLNDTHKWVHQLCRLLTHAASSCARTVLSRSGGTLRCSLSTLPQPVCLVQPTESLHSSLHGIDRPAADACLGTDVVTGNCSCKPARAFLRLTNLGVLDSVRLLGPSDLTSQYWRRRSRQ